MKTLFSHLAWGEYLNWIERDKEVARKINGFLREIGGNGDKKASKGKIETLRRELSGFRSRKITGADRLIYRIKDDTILVISCMWFLS